MRHLRLAGIAAMSFVALTPSLAAAQDINGGLAMDTNGAGTPMGDLQDLNRFATRGIWNQWMATRPARLSNLTPGGRKWLKAEIARQAEHPRSPIEVALDVDRFMAKDVKELAHDEKARPVDISRALVLKIMIETKNALAVAAWRAHRVSPPGSPSWDERLAQADVNKREAMKLQSDVSMALAMD